MQKALVLLLILIAATVLVGCNPPTVSQAEAVKGKQTSMTPDGKKGGASAVNAQN